MFQMEIRVGNLRREDKNVMVDVEIGERGACVRVPMQLYLSGDKTEVLPGFYDSSKRTLTTEELTRALASVSHFAREHGDRIRAMLAAD